MKAMSIVDYIFILFSTDTIVFKLMNEILLASVSRVILMQSALSQPWHHTKVAKDGHFHQAPTPLMHLAQSVYILLGSDVCSLSNGTKIINIALKVFMQ